MNASYYLNKKLLVDQKIVNEIEVLLDELLSRLEKGDEKTTADLGVFGKLHSKIYSIASNNLLHDKLQSSVCKRLEKFIENKVASAFDEEGRDLKDEELIKFILKQWKITLKAKTWIHKLFKTVKFAVPPSETIGELFFSLVYKKIQADIESYIVNTIKQDKFSEDIENFLRILVEIGKTADDFQDPFQKYTKKYIDKYVAEKKEKEQEAMMADRLSSEMKEWRGQAVNPYPLRSPSSYVGLRNQGSTCYLNSVIQALYMTPAFRRAIFQWRYDGKKKEEKCIPLQLQNLFARLKLSNYKAIGTEKLTKSFGWDRQDSFVQHDAQEFLRVLFESLGPYNIPVQEFYEGIVRDYVKCTECGYVGGRTDPFLDVQLVIRDVKHIDEAISNYQFEQLLTGENAYRCEICNKKVDALKGIKFEKLPDILCLHLKRFDIDWFSENLSHIKLNNRVVFPLILDMSKHVKEEKSPFHLTAILIHSGSIGGGHYFAYIKGDDWKKNEWFEFNDQQVNKIDISEIEKAFGSEDSHTNAYMLIYVREKPQSQMYKLWTDLSEEEELNLIPKQIRDEIEKENKIYLEGHKNFEGQKDTLKCKVYWKGEPQEISFDFSKTLTEAVKGAYETIGISQYSIQNVRLRRFDPTLMIPLAPFTDSEMKKTMKDVQLHENTFILEVKEDHERWPDYDPNKIVIRVQKFTTILEPPENIFVPNDGRLRDLAIEIEKKLKIPMHEQRIVKEYGSLSTVEIKELTNYDLQIQKDLQIKQGNIVYVENVKNNKLVEHLQFQHNKLTLKYNKPESKEFNQILIIDKRKTSNDLKAELAKVLDLNVDEFRVFLGKSNDSYEFKNVVPLNTLLDGSCIYIEKGKSLQNDQFLLSVYVMNEEKKEDRRMKKRHKHDEPYPHHYHHHHYHYERKDPFVKKFELIVPNTYTIADVKKLIFERDNTLNPSLMRLREKLFKALYPGRILLNDEYPFKVLQEDSIRNREVVLQMVDKEDKLTSNHLIIRTRRFWPSKMCVDETQELIITKDTTNSQLMKLLADKHKIKLKNLQVVKMSKFNVERLLLVDWDVKYDNDSLITKAPYFIDNVDLLLCRDVTEKVKFVERLGNGQNAPQPDRREQPLRFYDDDDDAVQYKQ